jgi:hypothetical protein
MSPKLSGTKWKILWYISKGMILSWPSRDNEYGNSLVADLLKKNIHVSHTLQKQQLSQQLLLFDVPPKLPKGSFEKLKELGTLDSKIRSEVLRDFGPRVTALEGPSTVKAPHTKEIANA